MDAHFSWTFESRFERSKQWYIIAASIAITSIIVSFLIGSFLFGIVMILFVGVYLLYDINAHPMVTVAISDEGIMIDGDLYPYNRIHSFGIMQVQGRSAIIRLQLVSKAIGKLDLLLDPNISIIELRTYLGNFLAEDPESEMSFIEQILLGLRL